ncbi:MAG: 3-hydroxyacyl-CoA dehydrogenase NAD-binding domain-containing protein [Pseudomonadota bacterium]
MTTAATIPEQVGIIGGGSIGSAMAVVFADAGSAVTLVEPDPARRDNLAGVFSRQHAAMWTAGLARGTADNADRIAVSGELGALAQSDLVVEAGPEALGVKQQIFAALLETTRPATPLATVSSAITVSQILPVLDEQRRAMVAHPANPPTVLRILEIVPAVGTDPQVVVEAMQQFAAVGFSPTVLGKEMPGFVFNRLQGALLREAYRLVEEGVVGVEGLDRLVREGLGPRWALCGPFENADLNTPGGIVGHAERMGPAYASMGAMRGETHSTWPPELVDDVARQRLDVCPTDRRPARREWREKALAKLIAARRAIVAESGDG